MIRQIINSPAACLAIGIVILGGTLAPARATLIDQGNATLDTATGLQWLDLTLTLGQSEISVSSGFGGYWGQGYRYATASQVCGLFGTFGDATIGCGDPGGISGPLLDTSATSLTALLGGYAGAGSYGLIDVGQFPSNLVGLGCIEATSRAAQDCARTGHSLWGTFIPDADTAYSHIEVGSFLVRTAIPEPSTLALFGFGIIGIAGIRSFRATRAAA